MEYPTDIEDQKDCVVIETMHGCYSDSGFCYSHLKYSLEEAIADFKGNPKLYSQCRVVNRKGEVLYNPNNLQPYE